MLRPLLLFFFFHFSFFSQNNARFVNPFIGTGGHGHTFPGAVLPFGMVQLSPDTRVDGSWDGCSGYHYSDDTIYGFSHTHLSGTGVSDWGDILLMPTMGAPSVDPLKYLSKFSHENEKAEAGFYQVQLDDDKIKVELTVTPRVGIHRYTFPGKQEGNIVLDLLHRDKTLDCKIKILDSVTVVGYRISQAWAEKQQVYFAIKFSKPFIKIKTASNRQLFEMLDDSFGAPEGAVFTFDLRDGKPLMVKVAISPTSENGAQKNLAAEAQHWDFETYKKSATDIWNKQLQKIEVNENNKGKMTVFYTALYHCFIHPSLNMDADGQYRGRDGNIHKAEGFVNYSVFSLWDTYRALHPLFTILDKQRTSDFINSFLAQYKVSGRLPMWELSGNETNCMIGFHSVSVIADAFTKGIKGFDGSLAFEAMKAAANYTAYGIPEFNRKGYLQIDDESESVSKSLEYAYDNWCIGRVAELLNKTKDVAPYYKRSLAYQHLFDASSGFMRPRKNGNWLSPFYPEEINNHFTEGNSWQYSFYVPHDISGLIALHGGKEMFGNKLDELFTTTEKTKGREQADVTGLIGQYAHGNEPSHHMAYLYNFVGRPEITSSRVQQICSNFYKNSPDGLIGNEDCGQMSAWYVFSSLGMYPVCPGSERYVLTTPSFSLSKINLEDGKTFSISSSLNAALKWTAASYNRQSLTRTEIQHEKIMAGGILEYFFTADGNSSFGPPVTALAGYSAIPAPIIASGAQVFKDSLRVSIRSNAGASIYYSTGGKNSKQGLKKYTQPFIIDSTSVVKARVISGNDTAFTQAHFYKLKYNYHLQILSKANSQYAADGAQTLIDGIPLDSDWRKGNWLGYQGQDFECTIDLKKVKQVRYLSMICLQDTRSWIVYPTQLLFFSSDDNRSFKMIGAVMNDVAADDYKVQMKDFGMTLEAPVTTRYLKVVARNFGKLPAWHAGVGGDSYIFAGELEIR